jgi:predicted nuclease of predicted toxin-antitoxin system
VRWIADEWVAAPLVEALRAAGQDVVYVAEVEPRASDERVVMLAVNGGRLLLTEDKDFGELAFRWFRSAPGLVLLRIDPARPALRWERLKAALDKLGEGLLGRHTVIDETRIRSRPLLRAEKSSQEQEPPT